MRIETVNFKRCYFDVFLIEIQSKKRVMRRCSYKTKLVRPEMSL